VPKTSTIRPMTSPIGSRVPWVGLVFLCPVSMMDRLTMFNLPVATTEDEPETSVDSFRGRDFDQWTRLFVKACCLLFPVF
jgi:hypothetical protein